VPANLYRRGDTWYARYSIAGQLQRVSLRTGDLRKARARFKALKKQAENHVQRTFGITEAASWNDAATAYAIGVLDSGGLKPSTAKRYRVSLRQIHDYMSGRKLPQITVSEISGYVDARRIDHATNATIRRDLTTMSRVFDYAKSRGMIGSNPVSEFDRRFISENRAPIREPSDEAVEAAANVAEQAGAAELGRLIRFLRQTGLRSGEASRARWEHVHGADLTVYETKNGMARTISVAVPALPEQRQKGRLFPGLPETSADLASRWQWVRRAMPKDQHFRLHDLRHAYAIAEIRAGRDIYDLSHHLGHSSVKVTEIYLGYAAGGRAQPRTQVAQKVTHEARAEPQKPSRRRSVKQRSA